MKPWHHGKLLFAAIVVLAATPLLYAPAGSYAVALLFAGWLWTSLRIKRTPLGTTPERRGVKSRGERA